MRVVPTTKSTCLCFGGTEMRESLSRNSKWMKSEVESNWQYKVKNWELAPRHITSMKWILQWSEVSFEEDSEFQTPVVISITWLQISRRICQVPYSDKQELWNDSLTLSEHAEFLRVCNMVLIEVLVYNLFLLVRCVPPFHSW